MSEPNIGNNISNGEIGPMTDTNGIRPGLNLASTCAIAVVLPGAWIFAASTLASGIYGGGPPVLIWGTLAGGLALSLFCSSLAEYASAFPSPAGCTHVASQVAPPAWAPFTTYFTGSIHSWAVLFTPPALLFACINLVFTCVCVMRPKYTSEKWHIFLAYEAANIGFFFLIKYGTVILSTLMDLGMMTFVLAFFITTGIMIGLSRHTATLSNESIWHRFNESTGFASPPLSALIGLTGPFYAFGPTHWLLNMADDIKNPSKNIPLGLISQQIGGTATLFTFYIVIFHSVYDFDAILGSSFPSIVGSVYQQATNMAGLTLFLLILLVILSVIALVGYISASIRLLYGFARGGAFTHANWWGKIDTKHNIPINVLYFSICANLVLGFLYLASPVGFQILLGSAQALFVLGYLPMLVPIVITGRRYFYANLARRDEMEKPFYSLSCPVGIACDVFSLFLQLILLVVFCLPSIAPVTSANTNWTPLFLVFVLGVTTIGWIFHGRHQNDTEIVEGVTLSPLAHSCDSIARHEREKRKFGSTNI